MVKEFERTQRVSHFLHEELARLLQGSVRDPRAELVNLTGVEVSRDLSHARVFFTVMGESDAEVRADVTTMLSKAAGFLRSELAKSSTMRTVPRLSFRFDESVGRGRDMESLLKEVQQADARLRDTSEADTNSLPEDRDDGTNP